MGSNPRDQPILLIQKDLGCTLTLRPIVLTAIPVARGTTTMPPYPRAFAPTAAKIRRPRSSRCGDSRENRSRIGSILIIPKSCRRSSHVRSASGGDGPIESDVCGRALRYYRPSPSYPPNRRSRVIFPTN